MAHLWELATDQQAELNKPGVSRIHTGVTITGQMLNPTTQNADGSWNFGTTYHQKTLDISPGILNKYIVVKGSAPVLLTRSGKANQQGNVKIQVDNTSQYVSTMAENSTLDYFNIQDAIVEIKAKCGSMADLTLFKGKVVKQPTEEEGKTTFDVRTILFDLIDVELKPEIDSAFSNQIVTQLYLTNTGAYVNNSFIDALGIEHIHPIGKFNEFGQVVTNFTNSKPDKVDLLRVEFRPNDGEIPKLGKYTIEFLNDTDFRVTQPDSTTYEGKKHQLFAAGFLQINPTDWNINYGVLQNVFEFHNGTTYETGDIVFYNNEYWQVTAVSTTFPPSTDPVAGWKKFPVDLGLAGAKIEFYCSYNVKGNPFRIVKNLIHKGLTGRWGKNYALDTSVLVDWGTLDALELIYSSAYINLSETNKDNSVFNPQTEDKPIRIKDLLQKILDHVGCQLAVDTQGRLTVNSSLYLMPWQRLYTYESGQLSSGETRKPSHKVFGGGPNYDFMRVKYGYDPISDSYAGIVTNAEGVRDKYNTYEVSFPYYSLLQKGYVESLAGKLFDIVKASDVRLEMNLLPNWGLPLQVGDKLKVDINVSPILPNTRTGQGEFWEIYSISKKIGDTVTVQCKMIPEPGAVDQSNLVCFAEVCVSTVC